MGDHAGPVTDRVAAHDADERALEDAENAVELLANEYVPGNVRSLNQLERVLHEIVDDGNEGQEGYDAVYAVWGHPMGVTALWNQVKEI